MRTHPLQISCLLALVASIGCQPTWRQRVVVTAAHAPDDAPEPIVGATARIECPEGVAAPAPSQATTNERGEAVLAAIGAGVSSDCTVLVEREGYLTQRFRVADTCVESADAQPFRCTAGATFAALVLEGRWNENDARAVAAELSRACLADPTWAGDSNPTLRLDRMINKTDEHIDLKVVADALLAGAIDSPKLRVLEMKRGEPGTDADFHLVLDIRSIVTAREGMLTRAYSVTVQVMRTTDTEIVCQATAERRKAQIQSKTAW